MLNRYLIDVRSRSKGLVSIPPAFIYCWEQLNDPCGVKDLHSRFAYTNPAYLDLLGLPASFDITGRLDSELPAVTAEFAEQFQLHDRAVENERQRKSSLEIHPFGRNNELQAYFFDKTPFFNDKGDVVGTYFHGRRAEHLPLDFYTSTKASVACSLILTPPNNTLTDSEWDIIFLLLQGYTQKEIAKSLNFSAGYINNKISVIFNKTGVSSTRQLTEHCRNMGWHNYVPKKFMTRTHLVLT